MIEFCISLFVAALIVGASVFGIGVIVCGVVAIAGVLTLCIAMLAVTGRYDRRHING